MIDEGMYPTGIAAADLDEDGRDDLIVPIRASDYYIYEAGIFLRLEGGLFQASGRVRADSTISAFDLDGDGHIDLEPHFDGVFRFGQGNGAFKSLYFARPDPGTARHGHDLDCDGVPDAITRDSDAVRVWRGLGDGEFEDLGPVAKIAASTAILSEMNGDGEPDVVTIGPAGLQVSFGVDGHAFSPPVVLATETTYTEVATGDLNEDGQLDVVALDASTVHILLSHP